MDQLIPITGYAESYEELCNKIAEHGEYYNVLNPKPFMTYYKLESVELGDTMTTTDVIGWFKNKAELESNVRIMEGEVYITGEYSPYTRWKAEYVDYVLTWVQDGEEEKKIVKKFKNVNWLTRSKLQPEEGIFYAVGGEVPYKVFGVVSSWEPVGSYISYVVKDINQLLHKPEKSNPGEIAFLNGLYYLYTGKEWKEIEIPEPFENTGKHTYIKDGKKYRLREGAQFGTLEFYAPRE